MSLERILGIDAALTRTGPVRPAAIGGAAARATGVAAEVRPLDTAAVLRVLIEEVRSTAIERLGFAPAPEREAFPVADRDRAASVLLKILTNIAGDTRFQPAPDDDPAQALLDVVRTGAERALAALERLPLAAAAPRTLVEATRDAVSTALPEPVRQRAQLMQSVQHALLAELASRSERSTVPLVGPLAARYGATATTPRPTLESAFAALLERPAPAAASVRPAPAELWASLEAPVRAALGATPEVDRALAALRERVLPAVAPALPRVVAAAAPDAQQWLDRVASRLAVALDRPVSTPPASSTDPRALAAAVVETLRDAVAPPPGAPPQAPLLSRALTALQAALAEPVAGARPAPASTAASTVAGPLPTPPGSVVEDARGLLLRLLASPEIAPAAQRDPAALARWFTDLALALARGLELPWRPDLVAPRRRLGLRRGRPQTTDRADERVPAIETSARDAQSDDERESTPDQHPARR